jgi:hypothetical protein
LIPGGYKKIEKIWVFDTLRVNENLKISIVGMRVIEKNQ